MDMNAISTHHSFLDDTFVSNAPLALFGDNHLGGYPVYDFE